MSSILRVNTITDSAGTGIPYQTGAVLQVKYYQLTTSQSVTYGSGDATIPNFQVSITPKSTSSIIKLEAMVVFEANQNPHDTMFFFVKNGTKLGNTQSSPGSRRIGIAPVLISRTSDAAQSLDQAIFTYFDAPSSTSPIVYGVGINSFNANVAFNINRTVSDANNFGSERGTSFMSATEIGG